MKILTIVVLLTLTVVVFFGTNPVMAAEMTAGEIMELADGRDDGDRSSSDMKMILIDKRGKERKRALRSYSLDRGDDVYTLMFFLAPADVKDTGFLTYDYEAAEKDDDQWLYLPALKKVKRIATSDKTGSFMGSDFSYGDLTKRRPRDYNYTFHKKQPEAVVYGQKCWVIESEPKSRKIIDETGYKKSIIFVRQDNLVVVRAINYLNDNSEVKYFDVKNMEQIGGIWTALEIHMTRKKGGKIIHRTILSLENVKYNQESVNETMFSSRRLEKGL